MVLQIYQNYQRFAPTEQSVGGENDLSTNVLLRWSKNIEDGSCINPLQRSGTLVA